MIVALLSVLALAPFGDPEGWNTLQSDEEGVFAYRRLEAGTSDAGPRALVRVTPAETREWTTGELTYEFVCEARTWTILGLRSLAADGSELRSVTVPEDRLDPEPIYAGDREAAAMYADLCPEGPPLEEREPSPLPIAVTPVR
ncbi:hypothetical protein [Brevundimonas sp. LjRoot202]|uniref:hypothetical protein n=1 Tax=Brevundimonas sp. LjRoot202 TaxID=3342281 RepID=UPI003ED0C83B